MQQLCPLLKLKPLPYEESKGLGSCREHWERALSGVRGQVVALGNDSREYQEVQYNLVQIIYFSSVIWEYFENWQEAMEKIKGKALK